MRYILRAVLLAAFVAVSTSFIFAPLVTPSSFAADNTTANTTTESVSIPASADADSWSVVAAQLNQDLSEGVASLQLGDTATAASHFQSAYNTDYVASNFAVVAQQYLAAETAQSMQSELSAFTTDVFVSSKTAGIADRVSTVSAQVTDAANQLDATADLKNPRDYATERAQKTAQEREQLDAAKTRTNEGRGTRTWSQIAEEMTAILDKAQTAATTGNDDRQGSNLVNEVYYQYYEKLGFEKTVMSAISGSRVSQVENQFKETRKSMIGGKSDAEVTANVQSLKNMLVEDAKTLDEGAAAKVNPFVTFATSAFGQAFIILLREGLEAILVVAAIIAYLVKAGQRRKVVYIYAGVLVGLIASGIMAALITFVFESAGSHQEVFEGVAALIAMVMLLYTSNWMLSKSSHDAWHAYVDEKTQKSISSGSVISLAALAFLAVFREGAETVIFYQALGTMISDSDYSPLVWGAMAATVVLIAILLLFRFTSVKIPYKYFFSVMSLLMSIMVVIFAGSGSHELIEADVINGTYMASWPTNDFLGLYPYVQTVVFQIVMAIIVIALYVLSSVRRKRYEQLKATQISAQNVSEQKSGHPEDN
ncbi:FTR1 family iron permease [Alloscardovia criceti]|uniref:FTR1 family iron permease n=1 Tax=Alloscardovia criceti TaxID=356828 RepID=UPI00036DECF9|nr:FTR1 family protein [Alloscardovia criceti]